MIFGHIWTFMVTLMRSSLIDSQKEPGFWYYQDSMELNRSNQSMKSFLTNIVTLHLWLQVDWTIPRSFDLTIETSCMQRSMDYRIGSPKVGSWWTPVTDQLPWQNQPTKHSKHGRDLVRAILVWHPSCDLTAFC